MIFESAMQFAKSEVLTAGGGVRLQRGWTTRYAADAHGGDMQKGKRRRCASHGQCVGGQGASKIGTIMATAVEGEFGS
eukprot:CAMPEP_0119406822 /NCGR_PEP_ID=MMETSP1335-20130426/1004_1 /TAXON_ID=259385 /ORGANISM="Chrysoculter rhomboideus, Strain RCC1486" /LENGTH=77 /DNA_ID=CAMNT_0007430915 /DNA_START=1 /DNA_END=235 /DNA_ORIENTATION=+